METAPTVDVQELESRVKDMYRDVADRPDGDYHFELGRGLAEHLGYPADVLDRIPDQSIESFAGVGYLFDLAELANGETVVDLGSGSGMDVFFAARQVGEAGEVVGIDFTLPQLEKARRLASEDGVDQVEFREGRIEDLPLEDASVDCVISNGVINLAPEKEEVFAEAARVLRSGGRIAIADIVSEEQLKESIVCNAELWAACIGGAAQQDAYRSAIEGAGLEIEEIKENPYRFISDRAADATEKYGVKSVSIRARKT
jgi:arsenite methyltransferase